MLDCSFLSSRASKNPDWTKRKIEKGKQKKRAHSCVWRERERETDRRYSSLTISSIGPLKKSLPKVRDWAKEKRRPLLSNNNYRPLICCFVVVPSRDVDFPERKKRENKSLFTSLTTQQSSLMNETHKQQTDGRTGKEKKNLAKLMRNNKALKKLLEPIIIIIITQGRRSISLHTHLIFYFVFLGWLWCFGAADGGSASLKEKSTGRLVPARQTPKSHNRQNITRPFLLFGVSQIKRINK